MTGRTGVARARAWLSRNRLGHVEPSALLVDRLEARRRGNWINGVTVVAFFVLLFSWNRISRGSGFGFDSDATGVGGLVFFMLTNVVLILALWAGHWYAYRAERRLVLARRTRSAHPTAAGVARVLGAGHLAAVLVVYGGALLVGAATALLAPRPPDRALALTFLGSIAVLAVLSGLALAGVLRRPSVAEDSDSLLVDDVLRTEDAIAAVAPFPIVVALVAAVGSTVGSWLIWSFLGYAVVGAASWLAAEVVDRRARTPAGATR
jgi:hypothetical protein